MKTQTPTKVAVLIFFQCMLVTVLFGQTLSTPNPPKSSSAQLPAPGAYTNKRLTYKIINAPNATFCYDVFADGKLMIHQTSVPALPGSEGFKTKADAGKVARLVMDKIKKGEMPPTVSIDEMKKLKVIK